MRNSCLRTNLAYARQASGLSYKEIAQKLDRNWSYIQKMELGVMPVSKAISIRLGRILGVEPEWLTSARRDEPEIIRLQNLHLQIKAQRREVAKKKINIRNALSKRVFSALIRAGVRKSLRTMELVGCSPEFLRKHLERRFQRGMTWLNFGQWQIDHIRPCASFDLRNEDQQRECFHYTNLQPLWASQNYKKSDKYSNFSVKSAFGLDVYLTK